MPWNDFRMTSKITWNGIECPGMILEWPRTTNKNPEKTRMSVSL
jgi:hypothetical protein